MIWRPSPLSSSTRKAMQVIYMSSTYKLISMCMLHVEIINAFN